MFLLILTRFPFFQKRFGYNFKGIRLTTTRFIACSCIRYPGTRGFSHVQREFSVLAEGPHIFGRRSKPRAFAARKTSGTEWCFLPSPLTFELFYRITFTPIRLKVSNCDHVGRHVNKCPKTHIILRKTNLSLKFIALRAIMTGSHRNSPYLM